MSVCYANTLKKIEHLKSLGHNVIEMWGCQFWTPYTTNEEVRKYVEGLKFVELSNSRDTFFGGRTEMFKKYTCASDGTIISYHN